MSLCHFIIGFGTGMEDDGTQGRLLICQLR